METPNEIPNHPFRYRLYVCNSCTTVTVLDGTPISTIKKFALAEINRTFKSDSIRDTGVTFEKPIMENGDKI